MDIIIDFKYLKFLNSILFVFYFYFFYFFII